MSGLVDLELLAGSHFNVWRKVSCRLSSLDMSFVSFGIQVLTSLNSWL